MCDTILCISPLCTRRINTQEITSMWIKQLDPFLPNIVATQLLAEIQSRRYWRNCMSLLKSRVLDEIKNEVAHRPGMVGYHESEASFSLLLGTSRSL